MSLPELFRRATSRIGSGNIRDALKTIADGFILLDRNLHCRYVNLEAARLLGQTAKELLGRPPWDAFSTTPEVKDHLLLAQRGSSPVVFSAFAKNNARWLQIRAYPRAEHSVSMFFYDVGTPPDPGWARDDGDGRAGARSIALADANAELRTELSSRKAAEVAQARLAAIVESSDDAIVSKTLDGIITSWNAASERLFGYSQDEAIGHSILLIIPPARHAEEANISATLRKGKGIEHFETERLNKDGRLIQVSLTVSPIRAADGTIIGASKIARDITERKRIEAERDRLLESERLAREQAQRINRMKDEFLATLSHELRSPLSAILGWAQLLARGNLPSDKVREGIEVIQRNAKAQKQLIEDLLDMSRIVSGKLRLDIEEVNLSALIRSAIETVAAAAQAKGIAVAQSLDSSGPPTLGDPNRLQQIVVNLLSNAVKFTPKGGQIKVALARVESHTEIVVSDTGEGIAAEFLPHIFERFRQGDASASRVHGGLGLGLAIVKQLTELHGGSVRVHSAGKGKGATFAISLPILAVSPSVREKPAQPDKESASPTDSEWPDLSGVHILVVDDEPDAQDLIQTLLMDCGAEVTVGGSAEAALALIASRPVDVLISDIGMPEVDGYQFLRQVRALDNGRLAKVPAIALTAFARTEDRTRALRAGYLAHVSKPVEPLELVATVAAIAGRTGSYKPKPD